jgi:hypothetical protein
VKVVIILNFEIMATISAIPLAAIPFHNRK